MAAYVILIRDKTTDPAELEAYKPLAAAAREGHALTPRAFYGPHEVLEGPPVEGVVILEFPTYAEAKAWYESPAYQAARERRLAGAEYRVLIVEGVS